MDIKISRQLGAWVRTSAAVAVLAALAACGGSKSDDGGSPTESVPELPAAERPQAEAAARFLTQSTFGANASSIDWVQRHGYAAFITTQMSTPQSSHTAYIDAMAASFAGTDSTVNQSHFRESFWARAVAGNDQLRQRAAYSLSQIFVISFADANLSGRIRGVTTYYDMLGQKAFGNYRDLLESVTLHPMMGLYLTSLRNQKEDGKGRVPDENYAREIMQLFSIGLYELNNDGTYKLNGSGQPIETYTHEDIQGLAKVFTGFSWYAGPNTADRTDSRFQGGNAHAERDWLPMQSYPKFHSVSEKKFLNTTIAAVPQPDPKVAPKADPDGDLKIALDRLYNHPNVGPFIGKQLIQRLVTSNPSPAYVARVSAVFNDNGSGVRGDMGAVFKAILLDAEARSPNLASDSYGKVREPLLRLSSLLRAFNAKSTSGRFMGIDDTDSTVSRLGQTAMRSPSVFNFYRPGYVPPGSDAAKSNLVSPELQLANEVSVAGYLNYIRGSWLPASTSRDINPDFTAAVALAEDVPKLVEHVNLLMTSGQMSTTLRTQIALAVEGRTIPKLTALNQKDVDNAKADRVRIAVMLTMGSADYLIQK